MKKARKWQFVALAFAVMFFLAGSVAIAGETYPQFPWSTWGEVSQTIAGKDNPGFKADGYLEQGIDWTKFGSSSKFSPVLNTFVGFRFTASNHPEYWWDNKLGPWFGAKLKWDVNPYPGAWGQIALGIRGEYYTYFSTVRDRPYSNDLRCVAFLQWSFGGKW
ncbi:MAG: hypothetical protein WC643_00105 [Parcubacteria group bacterium]|jgi:hypothetical protein